MISRPSDRLGLFAILVNEAANYSTKPASCTLWLTEATARANEKTPGREAGGPALSCALSNFLPRNLTFPATKLDVPKDRAKLRLATPAFCVNAWASVVLAIHTPQFAQASDPVGEICSGDVILRLDALETSDS